MNRMVLKTMLMGVVVLCVSAMFSCNNSDNSYIKIKDVKSAVEKLDALQDSANVVSLKVGYYEENDADDRFKLRQLAANEMITYKAEQINEYTNTWWGPRVNEHVFVTVALTEKGNKYVVTEPIKSEEDVVEIDCESFPESAVPYEEEIPVLNGAKEEVLEGEESDLDHGDVDYDGEASTAPATTPQVTNENMYKLAHARENYSYINVLAFRLKVAEVKDLRCTEEMWQSGSASCKVVLEVHKATPFGRVLRDAYDGVKSEENISLLYYIDKGWAVNE